MTDAPTSWRVPLGEPPPLRYWNGEYVVYNPRTGNTHLLDILTGELLQRIIAGAATTAELCRHVATFLEVPEDDNVKQNVAATLAVLDELGLIEPVGS